MYLVYTWGNIRISPGSCAVFCMIICSTRAVTNDQRRYVYVCDLLMNSHPHDMGQSAINVH